MSSVISRRLPLILLIGALIALVVYLQWPETVTTQEKHQRVVSVKTTTIALAEFKDSVEAIGTSRANEQVLITSKYSDLEVAFFANKSWKRLSCATDSAKLACNSLTLAASSRLLRRTKISPLLTVSGVLGFREISLGALIDVGDVITSLDDLSIIKVDFSIPERYLTTVSIGQNIEATNTAYQSEVFIGKVTSLDSRIDPVTRTLKVRAEISNADHKLRAGMLLNLQVVRKVEQILQLPESAVIPIEDKHFVFVIEDDKAVKKQLQIGRRYHGFVEVLGGIDTGTKVVIEGALKLRDGTTVNVLGS